MNEVKNPKKPLIFYYGVALLALLLFNFMAIPWLAQRQIQEVDYGTDTVLSYYSGQLPHLELAEVCAAVSVIDELPDVRPGRLRQRGGIFMKNQPLVFCAQAVVLGVAQVMRKGWRLQQSSICALLPTITWNKFFLVR